MIPLGSSGDYVLSPRLPGTLQEIKMKMVMNYQKSLEKIEVMQLFQGQPIDHLP